MRSPLSPRVLRASAVLSGLLPATASLAQEAMYTEAATMPGPGTFVLRQQFHYARFGSHPETDVKETDRYEWMTSLQAGLARGLSLQLDVPVEWRREEKRSGEADWDKGVEDLDLMLKARVLREDTGGVDTLRAALLAGIRFASGDDSDFSSQSVNPMIGGVITLVRGRHGFNQDLIYTFNTGGTDDDNFGGEGTADALNYGSAYLYRIAPAAYTSETIGAWYVTAEINGIYETNGDNELRFAPGLMYEGRRWAFEAMLQLPLYDELDHRPELDIAGGFGLRFSF